MEQKKGFQISKWGLLTLLIGVFLLTSISACDGTAPVLEDDPAFQEALQTSLAGTLTAQAIDAQRTKGAEAAVDPTATTAPPPTDTVEPSSTPTEEPTVTSTPEDSITTETVGNTATLAPTATIEIVGTLPSGPAVQVSVDTNCRSGPGVSYSYLGGLLVGEQATIVATDPQRQYWYITNPDQPGGYCWIWGRYAIVAGNTASLPVLTPAPSPTTNVNFSADFFQVETCGGSWQIEFVIKNTGSMDLESITVRVDDTNTGKTSGATKQNGFVTKSGCTTTSSRGRIKPGNSYYSISPNLPDNPTGHLLFASMTICNVDNLHGPCRTREWYFTP